MTTWSQQVDQDIDGIKTTSEFTDRGDAVDKWIQWIREADGGNVALGKKGDAAVINPATAATLIAYIKGLLTLTASPVGAALIGKAEDAVAASGDTGIATLAVRRDTPASSSADGDYHTIAVDSLGALQVRPVSKSAFEIQVDSAGLTTASTNYTAGDVLGTELTFANAAQISGWGGVITGAVIIDKTLKVNTMDVELWLFETASTPAADNAPLDWTDANMAKFVGRIKWATADWVATPSNAYNQQNNVGIVYNCAATSLFGVLVTRGANVFFTAVTDLRVRLKVVRD